MPEPFPLHIDRPIVLASGSPRRRDLLAQLGLEFDVVVPEVDETPLPGEPTGELVRRLAVAKMTAVAADEPDAVVIGADTALELDGEILGKPADVEDARRMLRRLNGRTHHVDTGVAVACERLVVDGRTRTDVTFVDLTNAEIEWYIATGEPMDKAGAYGLQGIGGAFIRSVRGSVSGVLGLPLAETLSLLRRDW